MCVYETIDAMFQFYFMLFKILLNSESLSLKRHGYNDMREGQNYLFVEVIEVILY